MDGQLDELNHCSSLPSHLKKRSLPMAKYKYVCSICGSENVLRDAWASWDLESQKWELASTFQAGFCQDCDGGASQDAVEIAKISSVTVDGA
jgi:hypothetical protein